MAYYAHFGVPDPKVTVGFPRVQIDSVKTRSFPIAGQIVDLSWKGKDFGLGVVDRLNDDISIRKPLMRSRDVEICAYPEHGCWVISHGAEGALSRELWDSYETIAQYLLSVPFPAGP